MQGGQAQRVTLAICLALKPSFLLLDEVTSALDHEAALKVERLLKESKAACIWVTHEDAQVSRVGGRCLQLPLGTEVLSMANQAFNFQKCTQEAPLAAEETICACISLHSTVNGHYKHNLTISAAFCGTKDAVLKNEACCREHTIRG